eukprot:TRINITY_DN1592_c0_g1_i1.p1 TRINITY_DN1592_c0_g1~~TRINITY_DN1592_c0_g1_i1.p1  ORF type:complete len:282 (+),score=67.70 TRINITY_DN1592_c0_g1_i1:166-1011(+)
MCDKFAKGNMNTGTSGLRYCRGYMLTSEQLEKFYFVLDAEVGSLKLFKSPDSSNAQADYPLQGGNLKKTERIVSDGRQTLPCFEFELGNRKQSFLVVPEHEDGVEDLRRAFQHCSKLPLKRRLPSNSPNKITISSVLRGPWEATGLVLGMLERIGESATGATKGIFGDSGDSESDGDPAGSETPELVRETEEALRKVLRTLTRIFAEPFRTEDEHEMSAVVGGIGEGAIEFVLKPVPAMPHIASLTARGMANNPRTVYLNTDKFIKKELSLIHICRCRRAI